MTTSPTRPTRRSGSWRAALTVPALAATTLLVPAFSAPAAAADGDSFQEYEAWCQNADDPGADTSTIAPVSLNFPVLEGQSHSARANAEAQRAGAYTDLDWDREIPTSAYESCGTEASFTQRFTVSAGTSGLAVGTPVTLTATVDLAGTLHTRNHQEIESDAIAEFFARYEVEDLDADCVEGEGGCYRQQVLDVTLEAERNSYSLDSTYSDPGGYLTRSQSWGLSGQSNAVDYFEDGAEHEVVVCDDFPCTAITLPGHPDHMAPLVVAPGEQVVEFTTTVGARLEVDGRVNTYTAGAGGSVDALADVLDGVRASLSAPEGSGLEILVGTAPFDRDTTAPTVDITASPEPNAAGWNSSAVTVTFSATDEAGGSGVTQLTRGATGAQPIPFTTHEGSAIGQVISAEGITEVSATARDASGNLSTPATRTVRIDKTAPTVAVTAPAPTEAGEGGTAVVAYTATATDALDAAPDLTCTQPSGSAFPIGTTTVTCTATDHAGNTASRSLNVVVTAAPGGGGGEVPVPTALEQVTAIAAAIDAMPLKNGLKQSLTSHVRPLQRSVADEHPRSCQHLAHLVKKVEVEARKGKGLTVAQAADLRTRTDQLATTLGC